MAKTKNMSFRLDINDLKSASEKSGINKPQKLIDHLLAEYKSHVIKITIYCLINPINNEVFYVGKTISSLEQRLKAHLKESQDNSKSEKREVIKSITNLNLIPIVNELESYECFCAEDELKINEREKYWIEFYSDTAKNVIGIKQSYKNKATIKNFNPQKPFIDKNGKATDKAAEESSTIVKIINYEFKRPVNPDLSEMEKMFQEELNKIKNKKL